MMDLKKTKEQAQRLEDQKACDLSLSNEKEGIHTRSYQLGWTAALAWERSRKK